MRGCSNWPSACSSMRPYGCDSDANSLSSSTDDSELALSSSVSRPIDVHVHGERCVARQRSRQDVGRVVQEVQVLPIPLCNEGYRIRRIEHRRIEVAYVRARSQERDKGTGRETEWQTIHGNQSQEVQGVPAAQGGQMPAERQGQEFQSSHQVQEVGRGVRRLQEGQQEQKSQGYRTERGLRTIITQARSLCGGVRPRRCACCHLSKISLHPVTKTFTALDAEKVL